MRVHRTSLPGVLLVEPSVHADQRGAFFESWHAERYAGHGMDGFVQANVSYSRRGVLRGMHYQQHTPQAKLVSVLRGTVFDVVVDVRRGSPTLGRSFGVELSGSNRLQLYVPEGFAHGFVVTGEDALVLYHCSAPYVPSDERILRWDDPAVGIDWPVADPILSAKDASAPLFGELSEAGHLPLYAMVNVAP